MQRLKGVNKIMSKIALLIILLGIGLLAIYLYGLYNPSIPILMYHHVNEHKGDMVTISPADFEKQMLYIKTNFNTIHLSELVAYLKGGKKFPRNTCVITFDDGYYDNFVYAYPVLKKYNLKATIFVITSRIGEERKKIKIKNHYEASLEGAFIDDVGRPLKGTGNFMTWKELQEMTKTGLIDIQSHTLTHARYFVSSKITDFNTGDFPWWLPMATGGDVRVGIPLYKDQKALLARRYFGNRALRHYLAQYVAKKGGKAFFESKQKKAWTKELLSVVKKYRAKQGGLKGHFETDVEKRIRLRAELYLPKQQIKERLNRKCLFIAWPWGKYNKELIDLAKTLGYCGAVTTEKGANTSGCDPMYLKRFDIKTGDLNWFKARMRIYKNGILAKVYPVIRGK